MIAKQIEEQKNIVNQLSNLTHLSADGKKELLDHLKSLSEKTQSLVEKATEQTTMMQRTVKPATDLEASNNIILQNSDQVDPELDAKLKSLQAEAKSLGLYPVRGRGRGRGGFRGSRMNPIARTLDNRTKSLKVVGSSDVFTNALDDHCKDLEGIESIEHLDNKTSIIHFASRRAAEMVLIISF
jgi:hypothetical protein